MAKLRRWKANRNLKIPYTRRSKFRKHSFVRYNPNIKIVKFNMGDINGSFDYNLSLISLDEIQIRQEAFEAARKTSNRLLEKVAGKNNYWFRIRTFPHHVVREHYLAAVAQADRMSDGMAHPFGKPCGMAAQIRKGQILMELQVTKNNLKTAKIALKRAAHKLPGCCTIRTEAILA